MELSQDLLEQIEHYLKGELSEKKLQKFEEELQRNPALVTAVAKQKKFILGIKKAAIFDLKDTLNDIHEEVVNTEKPPVIALGFWKPALLLAVVFAILGLIYFFQKNNTTPKSTNQNIPVATNEDKYQKTEDEITFGQQRRKINSVPINGQQNIYLNIQSSSDTIQFKWTGSLLTLYLADKKLPKTTEIVLTQKNEQQFDLKIDTIVYEVFPTETKTMLKKR